MTRKLLFALAAVFLAVPAYSQMQGGKAAGGMPQLDDKGVLERLHEDNQREIALAKLTEQRARTEGAKSVAQSILRDHAQADAQLMSLSKELKLTVSGKPTPKSEAERQHHQVSEATDAFLKTVPSELYDSVYLSNMVASHDHAILMLTMSKPKLTAKVQTFIDQLIPTLQHHRQEAYRALGSINVAEQGVGGAGQQQ
jgi:predicted outer membrane protein